MQWLSELNDAQASAVTHGEGPLLVVAGAGSGKTRVLTYRIAYLLEEKGIAAYHILAVTFTNKAAREMKERLVQLVGPLAEQVWMGTFHSTCAKILRRHAELLGFTASFTIFDTVDQLVVMRESLKDLDMDPKKFDPRTILHSISAAKNELIDTDQYAEQALDFWDKTVARVYPVYQQKLSTNDCMDFDDLIMQTVKLFQRYPEVLESYRSRFHYILVDEYQDTNHAQYRLVRLLAGQEGNLCVVGDADQSIYRFRGADIRNILSFARDYPSATVVKLEQNYRSTRNILDAANSLIENNAERPDKTLYTENPQGEKVLFFRAYDGREEARFVADELSNLRREGLDAGDVTILYRTHAQSRTFEEEFVKRGLPYRIVSGVRFYERKEIKDILAYLRVVANPYDNLSLRRIVNVPRRGIGDITQARLDDYAARQGLSLYDSLANAGQIERLSSSVSDKVLRLRRFVDECLALRERLSLTELTEHILTGSGYMGQLLEERSLESEARVENLKEFLSVTKQFEAEAFAMSEAEDALVSDGGQPVSVLLLFLEHVALISDVDAYDENQDAVTMMTVHSAKGLEFPVVFLVGMEDGVFPHARALNEPGDLEEERRLAYVGMTRAKQRLYFTCARERMLYGETKSMPVSLFVQEVPEHLIRDLSDQRERGLAAAHALLTAMGRPGNRRADTGLRSDGAGVPKVGGPPVLGPFAIGERVQHKQFGVGTVVQVQETKGDHILTVAFPGKGVKKLMAGMAPLMKVE